MADKLSVQLMLHDLSGKTIMLMPTKHAKRISITKNINCADDTTTETM